jgi:PKD repeat protein
MTGVPTEGSFMTQQGSTLFIAVPGAGSLPVIQDIFLTNTGVRGSGVLATLQFKVISQSASTTISLTGLELDAPTSPGATVGSPNPLITPTSDSSTATVSFVQGGAPAANAGQNQAVSQGTSVTFDASNSVSSGSNPTYTWSFTDGTQKTVTGKTASYTFSTPGIYTVTLTLQDSNGNSNSTVIITVQSNSKPVAVITVQGITAGQSVTTGQSIVFNGSSSYEPNNGEIQRYLWDMGDGQGTGTNATMTYAYLEAGTYNVTLTVFDATNLNGTASTLVNVTGSSVLSTPTPAGNSAAAPTESPTATPVENPTAASTAASTSDPSGNVSSMPPTILAILVIVTIAVLAGSTVWLRKRI